MKDIMISALHSSGKTLLGYFEKPMDVRIKESQSSVVTEADLKSESVIINMLADNYPEHNIISEEGGFRNNNSEFTWVVDPLDGTSNFAAGIPWFGVLITLFENNIPVLAGAYLPVSDTLYYAEKGGGAFKNNYPMPEIRDRKLRDSLIAFSVDYSDDEEFLNKGISLYKFIIQNSRNIRSTNSLFDFTYIAEGKLGGCVNLYTKVWDISGLGLIIREAGGMMTDIYGNEIIYQIGDDLLTRNFPVIAGSFDIVESLRREFR
jgi:myo-inositol-1(or 4)-monophosphatase